MGPNLDAVVNPIVGLLETIFGVAIPIVGAIGAIFCIVLGVKFAKAEEPQEREKAKTGLKNAIIGFVLIFVLVVVLRLGTPIMVDWLAANTPAPTS
ncbi:MAG: pilin [Oscillospiraceae bacterium]|nr:pilin [Oscillospiraceae bacterium]